MRLTYITTNVMLISPEIIFCKKKKICIERHSQCHSDVTQTRWCGSGPNGIIIVYNKACCYCKIFTARTVWQATWSGVTLTSPKLIMFQQQHILLSYLTAIYQLSELLDFSIKSIVPSQTLFSLTRLKYSVKHNKPGRARVELLLLYKC